MSFAEEFVRVKNKEVMPTNDNSPAAPTGDEAPTYSGTEMFNEGLEASKEAPLAEVSPDGKVPTVEVAGEPKAPAKIRIGTHEFNSVEEATKYANDLELAMMQKEAFEQGKESATPKADAAPVKTIEEELEEELFSDPKAALAKYKKHIKDEIFGEYNKSVEAAKKAQEAEATRTKTWNSFYEKNSDLAKSQDLVDFVLQRNPQLLEMPSDLALAELASKTRAYIGSARETQLPSHELQNKPVITPKGGAPSTTTKTMTTEKALDFISQVRKLNKNKASQDE